MRALLLATAAGARDRLVGNLGWLAAQGVREVAVALPSADVVVRAECEPLGLDLMWLEESAPLGSAGALRRLREFLAREPFLVVDGSRAHAFALHALIAAHDHSPAVATVAVEQDGKVRPGQIWFERERSGRILRVLAQPDPQSRWTEAGVCLLNPVLIDHVPDRVPADIARDLFPLVLRRQGILLGYAVEPDAGELPAIAREPRRAEHEGAASG